MKRFTFNAIGIFTTDNAKMVDFYCRIFGFETSWNGIDIDVEMRLGDSRILLFPRESIEKMTSQKFTYPSGINGTMEISFDVPTFSDVDKEYNRAVSMGAKPIFEPTTEPWGQRTCYVADPEGNLIEISSFNEVIMQTDRILLRPWQESDAEALYKYASDPDVGSRAGWPPHQSVEESLEIIRTVFNNDTTWAIILKETNEPIGTMGYMPDCPLNLPAREGEPLIGYWIGKPYWNQGICTEALQLLIDYVRKETTYNSLISSHFMDNPASGRVMEKCGFVPTGETVIDEEMDFGKDHPMRVLRLELPARTQKMKQFTTPPNHINFLAKNLFGEMGHIINGSIAYLDLNGGGPTTRHSHKHNHLFIVTKGEARVEFENETVIIHTNEAYIVKGSRPHSVWNNSNEETVMIGISVE